LRALVGVITDITERKLVEDNLQASEAKQRAMIENIVDVIAIVDRDGINRYESPNIKRWFGWRTRDVVGSAIWDNVHPDDLKGVQKVFADLLG
jgi:PAS domain S-box-containing protein